MEYTLKLNDQQLNAVAAGLAELPFKVAQPVIAEIQIQITAASQPTVETTEKVNADN